MTDYHLVVLVHGLWGNASHFDHISKTLTEHARQNRDKGHDEELIVYTTTLNEGFKTYDGIDVCGFRVAREISDQIDSFKGSCFEDRITKFSIVGYSLGGLISRYAVGLLYQRQFFKKREIQLINFATFCTPHVGVLAPGRNMAVRLFNSMVPWFLGNTGRQMFLKDEVTNVGIDETNEGIPLIHLMSLENTVFYRALESFKYRSLYANIINDRRTAWWTSGISLNDPFFNIDEDNGVKIFQYVRGFDTVVLDRDEKIVIAKVLEPSGQDDSRQNDTQTISEEEDLIDATYTHLTRDFYFFNYWLTKIGKWILVVINILIIAPLLFAWKIIQSFAEMTISTVRVTRFVNKYSHQLLHDFFETSPPSPDDPCFTDESSSTEANYEMIDDVCSLHTSMSRTSSSLSDYGENNTFPLEYGTFQGLEESLYDQADNLIESIYDAIERKNTHTGFVEESQRHSTESDGNSLSVTIRELENHSFDQLVSEHGNDMIDLIENLCIDLSPVQVAIIGSLNKLNWDKYPIYIRKTPNAHACAIVRQLDPNFNEGKIVVDHWVKRVFQTN